MSIKALNWAIHEADVTNPLQKWMLVCLADFHNQETGQCNPSVATLLKMSGMKRSTVYQYLKELEAEGIITKDTSYRENGSQTTNYYYLNMDSVHELDGGVHELDPLNQYTNINIVNKENKENIVNNVDVVDNVVNNVVPIDTNDDLELPDWYKLLQTEPRWIDPPTGPALKDYIAVTEKAVLDKKESILRATGQEKNVLTLANEFIGHGKTGDKGKKWKDLQSAFRNWISRADREWQPKPPTGNASHSNQDKYTQAKSELGR